MRVGLTKRISDIASFTLAAWVKRTRMRPVGYQSIISRQLGSGIAEVFDMSVSLDRLQTYAPDRTSAGVTAVSVPRTAPVNDWFHAAATYDGRHPDHLPGRRRRKQRSTWTQGIARRDHARCTSGPTRTSPAIRTPTTPGKVNWTRSCCTTWPCPPEAIMALAGGMRPPVPDP